MVKVINIANFKGGVGKTTTTVIFSYILAEKKNNKVLLVDFDPQGNATDLVLKTFNLPFEFEKSIYGAMKESDLSKAIIKCSENLDLIPAEGDLRNFNRLLNSQFGYDYNLYPFLLDALLEPIKDNYDYVFIDVPPTLSDYTDSAIVASDYLAVVIQTQESSLAAAEQYLPYIEEVVNQYETSIQFVCAIPVLMKADGKTDKFILEEASKIFGSYLTKNKIKIRERIKAWGVLGIKDEDMHDKDVLNMYEALLDEFLKKMSK